MWEPHSEHPGPFYHSLLNRYEYHSCECFLLYPYDRRHLNSMQTIEARYLVVRPLLKNPVKSNPISIFKVRVMPVDSCGAPRGGAVVGLAISGDRT